MALRAYAQVLRRDSYSSEHIAAGSTILAALQTLGLAILPPLMERTLRTLILPVDCAALTMHATPV
jgi:hypothetical protein